jgi:hypothetical protein
MFPVQITINKLVLHWILFKIHWIEIVALASCNVGTRRIWALNPSFIICVYLEVTKDI